MTKKQWYNSKTNQLQSMPPNGTTWIHPDLFAELYPDWYTVDADFRLPEKEKTKAEKITDLNSEYEEKYTAKLRQLSTAQALNKSTVVTAVQQQYAVLMAEHKTKKEAINNG